MVTVRTPRGPKTRGSPQCAAAGHASTGHLQRRAVLQAGHTASTTAPATARALASAPGVPAAAAAATATATAAAASVALLRAAVSGGNGPTAATGHQRRTRGAKAPGTRAAPAALPSGTPTVPCSSKGAFVAARPIPDTPVHPVMKHASPQTYWPPKWTSLCLKTATWSITVPRHNMFQGPRALLTSVEPFFQMASSNLIVPRLWIAGFWEVCHVT